jgi:hypothetical protein
LTPVDHYEFITINHEFPICPGYFHHVPTVLDMASADEAHDIFGRERFSQHRDDMGGVGSFNSETWPVDGENLGIVFL